MNAHYLCCIFFLCVQCKSITNQKVKKKEGTKKLSMNSKFINLRLFCG